MQTKRMKKTVTERNPRDYLEHSTLLVSRSEVQAAIARMAAAINDHYGDRSLVLLVVMTVAASLARRGVESWILDGLAPGRLARALAGDKVPGTRVLPAVAGGAGARG